MDIIFTIVGILLVVAAWPALLVYVANDSMLREPRRSSGNWSPRVTARIARLLGRHTGPAIAGRTGATCH